jgi:cytokinin dehydrogenase
MAPDRRTFLSAGFGVTAAVASRTNGLMTAARSHAGETPSPSGDLNSDPNVRGAAAQDFDRLVHKQPRAVSDPHRVPTLPA